MTYRDPSPPPADERIETLERTTRRQAVAIVAIAVWIWVITFASFAENCTSTHVADLEARTTNLETRTADLASCRVLDETESDERRRVTAEQDRALCDRFCDGASSATCTWRPGGVRACACRCASRWTLLANGDVDVPDFEILEDR